MRPLEVLSNTDAAERSEVLDMTGGVARYEVYQLVVGRKELPLRACLLRGGDEQPVDFTYSFWLLVDGSSIILVDTGFDADVAGKRGVRFERTAVEALRALGIAPTDVSSIVLSHLHFDHAGGLEAFPQARVFVQQADIDFYTGEFMRFALCSSAIEKADIAELQRIEDDGRLVALSGDAVIADGIKVHHIGGHTPGMQAVQVSGHSADIVLASDAAHLYANLEKQVPFPVLHDVPTSCVAFERLAQLSAEGAVVVPGHDGSVMHNFMRMEGRVAGFAARLS
jgi:glyoxylase-like metal-dependent hydrolase (beta-lactamase superfamily II)